MDETKRKREGGKKGQIHARQKKKKKKDRSTPDRQKRWIDGVDRNGAFR